MVIEVLGAHAQATMRVGVVAPAEYAHVRQVVRENVAQPVDAVARRSRIRIVSVEAVYSDWPPIM